MKSTVPSELNGAVALDIKLHLQRIHGQKCNITSSIIDKLQLKQPGYVAMRPHVSLLKNI